MDALIKIRDNGRESVVSMFDLYEFLGVSTDFSTWCKRMFEYGFEDGRDFSPILGKSTGGRPFQDYSITLDCAKEIAMLQRSEKGKLARRYFIECEKKLRQPKQLSAKELALMVLKAEEEKEQALLQLNQANQVIIEQAPVVEYANEVLNSTGVHTTTTIAKELGMSAISLNQLLKSLGIQYFHDNHWILYRKYESIGLTKTKTHTYTDSEGRTKTSIQTVWTEKGRKFVHDAVKSYQAKKTG